MGFPRQKYWSGLPFPYAGDLPNQGIEPVSPAWQGDSLPLHGIIVTEPFTFPEELLRFPSPQGQPAVPRGSEVPGEGTERRPKEPRQEVRTDGAGSTRALVHDPVIPRKNGTFRSFRPQRGGGGTLRSSLGEATRAQPPESGTPGTALRE